ncbi:unnamed protein product [Spirodela intermedia]|uniref:Uncharacterized protein n=1 Tax=Spirodela intermedia TaxID=51605 RepID=A0A811GE48_SPIIN|nr:unnamed protein product [Spirodela intermedia]
MLVLAQSLPLSVHTKKTLAGRLATSRRGSWGGEIDRVGCYVRKRRPAAHPRLPLPLRTSRTEQTLVMEGQESGGGKEPPMKLLFVEMGVGYDQHGQDITAAAMRACRDAISSNSIPAFRRGSIPGVNSDHMKLQIRLGVPRPTQQLLDIERVKSVFPYGQIIGIEVVDGGLICSSGVRLEAMGDKNDDCYVVNAAVYVGY